MKKVNFRNKFEVSEVCLGAMNFGTTTDERMAFDILDAFVDKGGNFIDTSNNYAHWQGTGDESETTLGKWIKSRGGRDKLIIATKVGFDRHGEGQGLKKGQIEYWIDESLRKLNTDYVDLYYAHTDDELTPLEETMTAFDGLVRKGKVRMLGASNYDVWRIMEAKNIALDKGMAEFEVNQQRFTYLFSRSDEAPKYKFNEFTTRERLRYLERYDMPLVCYSCLCRGGYDNPEKMPADYIQGKRLDTLRSVANETGVSATQLVIAWLTHLGECEGYPNVVPLFAASNVEQLERNLKECDIAMSDAIMERLNKA